MGLIIKIVLLLVVVAAVSLFVLKGQDDKPLMTVNDLKEPDMGISGAIERLPEVKIPFTEEEDKAGLDAQEEGAKTQIYSWKDEQGNIHFTDQPPETDGKIETIKLDPNINVVPPIKDPNKPENE